MKHLLTTLLISFLLTSHILAELPQPRTVKFIEDELKKSGDLGDYDVAVGVYGDTVTLAGVVTTSEVKDRIERVALSADGISNVRNRIRVSPEELKALRSDDLYKTKISEIRRQISANKEIRNYSIHVGLRGDRATLSGQVGSQREAFLIQSIVREAPGVKTVDSDLIVVPTRPMAPSDQEIEARVYDALRNSEELKDQAVRVSVRNGVVYLNGSLPTFRAVDRAIAIALMVDGVGDVESELAVEGREYPRKSKTPTSTSPESIG